MFTLSLIVALLFAHFIADFILQSDDMALKKSKDNLFLAYHVCVYSTAVSILLAIFCEFAGLKSFQENWNSFFILTYFSHFITDYFTSRLNSYLWTKESRHWFFCAIGMDQFIHYVTLLILAKYLILN